MLANRSLPHDRRLAVMIGLVLMVATYLIFSIRAVIDPLTPGHFISLKRLIATAAGAGLFLLAVSKAARIPARGWAERITAMLWITAIGSLAMLAFRIGYDMLLDNRTDAVVARNARWILAWLGYFVAAVGGYFAITFVKQAMRRNAADVVPTFDRDEVASVVLDEVAEWSPEERRALLNQLVRISDYEEADPVVGCLDRPQRD